MEQESIAAGPDTACDEPVELLDRHYLEVAWGILRNEDDSGLHVGVRRRLCEAEKCTWALQGIQHLTRRDAYMADDAEARGVPYKGLTAYHKEALALAADHLLEEVGEMLRGVRERDHETACH